MDSTKVLLKGYIFDETKKSIEKIKKMLKFYLEKTSKKGYTFINNL